MDGRVIFDTPGTTTRLGYELSGRLSAASSTADPARRALGQGSFTLSRPPVTGQPTTFTFSGALALPGFSGAIGGSIATDGRFCLTGALAFPALGVNGTGTIGSSCATPGLAIRVVAGGFTFDGRVTATGTVLAATFNDVRQLMIQGNHRYCDVIAVCSDLNVVQDWQRFTTLASGSLAWSNAGFSLTSGLNFDATIGIRTSGTRLCATVPGLPEWCIG